MSVTLEQVQGISGSVLDQNSDKVGSIGQIYLDDTSGEPTWITVKTGLFGTSETFVPLSAARIDGDDLRVGVAEDVIKKAPRVDSDGSISPAEEDELYRYYGLGQGDSEATDGSRDVRDDHAADLAPGTAGGTASADDQPVVATTTTGTDADATTTGTDAYADAEHDVVGHDTSGPTTDDAMTRSEERLNVGTTSRESGRARLRKYVTTETVTETVPVQHEEVTLEREPITDANYDAAQSGPAISEEEHEVVLHEEVPVVDKDVVAVERVALGKETVADEATVTEDVRTENVELVDPDPSTDR